MTPTYSPRSEKHARDPEARGVALHRSGVMSEADATLDLSYAHERPGVLAGIVERPAPPAPPIRNTAEVAPVDVQGIQSESDPSDNFLNIEDARSQVAYIHHLTESGQDHGLAA